MFLSIGKADFPRYFIWISFCADLFSPIFPKLISLCHHHRFKTAPYLSNFLLPHSESKNICNNKYVKTKMSATFSTMYKNLCSFILPTAIFVIGRTCYKMVSKNKKLTNKQTNKRPNKQKNKREKTRKNR